MRQISNKGFTLIEVVVVIVIVGILSTGGIMFIRDPLQSYIDTENNSLIADTADSALRRMARDIRNALPNSLRTTTDGADSLLEFMPVITAGRYRATAGTSATDDPIDFVTADDAFDVLGQSVTVSNGDNLVIHNLGTPGSDVYAGDTRRAITTLGTVSKIAFSGAAFPAPSTSSTFSLVSTPVSFVCDMTNKRLLRYSGYAIQAIQPTTKVALDALATPKVMAEGVTGCQINYISGSLQRSGMITLSLTVTKDTAKAALMHQVAVANSL